MTFEQLAAELAVGADFDVAAIEAILDAAGKSVDDLERAVAAKVRKRKLIARAAGLDALRERRRQLQADVTAAQAELDRAIAVQRETLRSLQSDLSQVERELLAADRVLAELESMTERTEAEQALGEELTLLSRGDVAAGASSEKWARIQAIHQQLEAARQRRLDALIESN
jgi:hypothetical protein